MSDVKWHPQHPATFAVCDVSGLIEVWNLNENTEGAVMRHQATESWHKLCWDKSGRKLLTGNMNGQLALWSVSRSSVVNPKSLQDEVNTFDEKVKLMEPISGNRNELKYGY